MSLLIDLISIIMQSITLLVIVHVFLSYFMSPFHPVRAAINTFVEPLLRPIRNILPTTGMVDFSPIVLILLVQISGKILISLLRTIG
jgi:YggT family protein